jgi:hypothetical protein
MLLAELYSLAANTIPKPAPIPSWVAPQIYIPYNQDELLS